MVCKNCGAVIPDGSYKCEYCGTQYGNYRSCLTTYISPMALSVCAETTIPHRAEYEYSKEALDDYIRESLAEKLIDYIKNELVIYRSDNLATLEVKYKTKIKVEF